MRALACAALAVWLSFVALCDVAAKEGPFEHEVIFRHGLTNAERIAPCRPFSIRVMGTAQALVAVADIVSPILAGFYSRAEPVRSLDRRRGRDGNSRRHYRTQPPSPS